MEADRKSLSRRVRQVQQGNAKQARRLAMARFGFLALVLVSTSILAPLLVHAAPGHLYVVASGSMGHTIPRGSIVSMMPGPVGVGTIVVYRSATGVPEVHRVVEIRSVDGATAYVTRGDANPAPDSYLVAPDQILGTVRFHAPFIGFPWLIPSQWNAFLLAGMIFAYVGIAAWDSRAWIRRVRVAWIGAAAIVFVGAILLVLSPAVSASVTTAYPKAAHTVNTSASSLPLSAGTMASASVAGDSNSATVTANAPKLWKEIQMWGCTPVLNAAPTCAASTAGLTSTYYQVTSSITDIDTVNDYTGTVSYYFEAVFAAPAAGTIYAQLVDRTSGAIVASEISTASTTAVVVRSGALTLSLHHEYLFQMKQTNVAAGTLYSIKILVSQQFPTKTMTQVLICSAAKTQSTSAVVPPAASRWLYDSSGFDGTVTAYFESVMFVTANTGTARLRDLTLNSLVTGSTITTTATADTRVRSSAITLVTGHEYQAEVLIGSSSQTLTVEEVRIIIAQTSAFTKTIRYEDLAWTATTASTSFAAFGYSGRYNTGSEWGPVAGYLEATMLTTSGTVSARLFDNLAGAAISGSQIDITSTTNVRSRIATPATLNVNDAASYALQVKTTAGTATVRGALLIVYQTNTKTYDTVLKVTNSASACTWSFQLSSVSSTNLARITALTVGMRDSTSRDQILVASGSITQSTGTAVTAAAASADQFYVLYKPASAGSSTLTTSLTGTCNGLHSIQPIVFNLQ